MDMPLKRDPLWAISKHGRKSPRPRRPQKQRLQSPSPKGSRWPTGPRSKELGAPMECPTTALSWASPHPDLPELLRHLRPSAQARVTGSWGLTSPRTTTHGQQQHIQLQIHTLSHPASQDAGQSVLPATKWSWNLLPSPPLWAPENSGA